MPISNLEMSMKLRMILELVANGEGEGSGKPKHSQRSFIFKKLQLSVKASFHRLPDKTIIDRSSGSKGHYLSQNILF